MISTTSETASTVECLLEYLFWLLVIRECFAKKLTIVLLSFFFSILDNTSGRVNGIFFVSNFFRASV